MPRIVIHRLGQAHAGEVKDNVNLVVRAGIKQFPFPHLRYGCGMGKCGKCASRVLGGAEHLPPPNWKEQRVLGEARLADGWRLMCQLWIEHDLEIAQPDEPLAPLATLNAAAPAAGVHDNPAPPRPAGGA
ncbi:MAG: (2Fe-2S)-binding protein [Rubrivivax sp.]|nr:(2Fe-2S)-binding protein [Rubrivivax sp.]